MVHFDILLKISKFEQDRMSFSTYKKNIEQGDTVILYIGIKSMYALKVEPFRKTKNGEEIENIYQTRYLCLDT